MKNLYFLNELYNAKMVSYDFTYLYYKNKNKKKYVWITCT